MIALALFASALAQSNFVDVAIMHSATGTMAISEITVINAEILAIEEINADGGVLGRQIRYTIFDGQSNPAVFNQKAIEITSNSSFVTTFGCWTSSSRKAVLPVFEATNKQLWYPVQYEGQECSKNVFYSGATPNQQIEPSVFWLLDNYPRNMYLIGSDYVFPRTANAIIKSMLVQLGGNLIGEAYAVLPQNAQESAQNNITINNILDDIRTKMPNGCVIYNSLNGDANVQLFTLMEQKGMTPDRFPTMSVSITETEAAEIGIPKLRGHFAAWNYFMSDPAMVPRKYDDFMSLGFIQRYRSRFGNTSLVNDPMEAAYINVYVWAAAVERAQSFDVDRVRRASYGITFDAPEGVITMQNNHHISKYPRIGRFRADGLFDVVWEGTNPVYPVPWNQYIAETNGQFCNHASDRLDASRFAPPQVRVALLYDPNHADILKTQMLAIEDINRISNGVNNRLVRYF
jgi:urea transport system substrate-binding protein